MKFTSPLNDKEIKNHVRQNAEKYKKLSVNDKSLILQLSDLWPAIDELGVADKARFWRVLRAEIMALQSSTNKSKDKPPRYFKSNETKDLAYRDAVESGKKFIRNLLISLGLGYFSTILIYLIFIK